MKFKIILAFPGIGKTWLANYNPFLFSDCDDLFRSSLLENVIPTNFKYNPKLVNAERFIRIKYSLNVVQWLTVQSERLLRLNNVLLTNRQDIVLRLLNRKSIQTTNVVMCLPDDVKFTHMRLVKRDGKSFANLSYLMRFKDEWEKIARQFNITIMYLNPHEFLSDVVDINGCLKKRKGAT